MRRLVPQREKFFAAAKLVGEVEEDVEIRTGFAGWVDGAVDFANSALGVRVSSLLLAPDSGGKNEVGQFCCRREMKAVLNNEEVEIAQRMPQHIDVGKGDDWIGADDPERADFSSYRCFNNVGIGEPARGGDASWIDVPDARQLVAV